MKFYYNVQNNISDKWIYDAIVSIKSVDYHNKDSEFYIYYDTDKTRSVLEKYLADLDITYIKDNWSDSFAKSIDKCNGTFGNGIYNLFHAIANDKEFIFLDTDTFCFGEISIPETKGIICRKTTEQAYTKAITYVHDCRKLLRKRMKRRAKALQPRKNCFWFDELVLKDFLGDVVIARDIKNIVHFGNSYLTTKNKNVDKGLFNKIISSIQNVSAIEYLRYIKGVK